MLFLVNFVLQSVPAELSFAGDLNRSKMGKVWYIKIRRVHGVWR